MIQNLVVWLIFGAALVYIGRMVYRNFSAKSGCSQGCGKCAIDFDKLAKEAGGHKNQAAKPIP